MKTEPFPVLAMFQPCFKSKRVHHKCRTIASLCKNVLPNSRGMGEMSSSTYCLREQGSLCLEAQGAKAISCCCDTLMVFDEKIDLPCALRSAVYIPTERAHTPIFAWVRKGRHIAHLALPVRKGQRTVATSCVVKSNSRRRKEKHNSPVNDSLRHATFQATSKHNSWALQKPPPEIIQSEDALTIGVTAFYYFVRPRVGRQRVCGENYFRSISPLGRFVATSSHENQRPPSTTTDKPPG